MQNISSVKLRLDVTTYLMLSFFSIVSLAITTALSILFLDTLSAIHSGGAIAWGSPIVGIIAGPFAALQFLFSVGMIGIMFLKVALDIQNKNLILPYWGTIDARYQYIFNNSYRSTHFMLSLSTLFSREKAIPLSQINSVLVCRLPELQNFLSYYKKDEKEYKKIAECVKFYNPQAVLGDEVLQAAGLSAGNLAGFAAGAAAAVVVSQYETPAWIMVVETNSELIIKKLDYFLDGDPPYLAEAIRSLGVNVLTPKNEDIFNEVSNKNFLPKRKFMTGAMKLFIFLIILLGIFIFQIIHS